MIFNPFGRSDRTVRRPDVWAGWRTSARRVSPTNGDPAMRTDFSAVRERLGDHPVSLLLEALVAHLVGPHRGTDRLSDPVATPPGRFTRVTAIPVEERRLERRVGPELLDCEPCEVRQGRTQAGAAEVDHAHH